MEKIPGPIVILGNVLLVAIAICFIALRLPVNAAGNWKSVAGPCYSGGPTGVAISTSGSIIVVCGREDNRIYYVHASDILYP